MSTSRVLIINFDKFIIKPLDNNSFHKISPWIEGTYVSVTELLCNLNCLAWAAAVKEKTLLHWEGLNGGSIKEIYICEGKILLLAKLITNFVMAVVYRAKKFWELESVFWQCRLASIWPREHKPKLNKFKKARLPHMQLKKCAVMQVQRQPFQKGWKLERWLLHLHYINYIFVIPVRLLIPW